MSGNFRICLVHGFCGNRIDPLLDYLKKLALSEGFSSEVITRNVWEDSTPPKGFNLVLQVLSVFEQKDTGCPVINVQKLLADFKDIEINSLIVNKIREN